MGKTELISTKVKNLDAIEKFSEYIGKKVFSKSGAYVGKIKDVVIRRGSMIGVLVKSKRKLFIGREFFETDSEDAIMLSIEPVTLIIGKQVFDSLGKKVGKVVDLERADTDNQFRALIIKKRIYFRPFTVPRSAVTITKHNVLLNKPFEKEVKK